VSGTPTSLSSVVAALGLAGGFLVARRTGRRDLGGALFAAAPGARETGTAYPGRRPQPA